MVAPFARLVSKLFARPESRRDRRRGPRLGLESLEAREVPAVTFTVEDLSNATEGGSAGQFRVTANGDAADFTSSVVAVWGYSGSATYSTDYTTNPSFPSYLTFNSPGSTQTITITAVDDETIEGNETVTLTVQRYTMFPTGPQYSDSLTLYDNDPTVTVSRVADAAEGGSAGSFRFTRTGSTSGSLSVSYTVQNTGPGIADAGSDYTALSGSVTIPSGYSYADVSVTPIADNLAENDEDVTVTVSTSSNYLVGGTGSASLYVFDDAGTAETLIHSETFELSGTSGSVSVELEVVYNADGAEGLYTWTYTVTNPEEEQQDWTDFAIPIEEIDDDVDNLQSSLGWTGTIGLAGVSWAVGTGTILAPGQVGVFSFTTLPRLVGPDTISVSATGAVADLPTAPAPRPVNLPQAVAQVSVSFPNGNHWYTAKFVMDVHGSAVVYEAEINIPSSNAATARDFVFLYLESSGWAVQRAGDTGFVVRGVMRDGRLLAVKRLTCDITNQQGAGGSVLVMSGSGPVDVIRTP